MTGKVPAAGEPPSLVRLRTKTSAESLQTDSAYVTPVKRSTEASASDSSRSSLGCNTMILYCFDLYDVHFPKPQFALFPRLPRSYTGLSETWHKRGTDSEST